MDCEKVQKDIVRVTYKQLKEMAEGNNREEVADGVHSFTVVLLLEFDK